MTPLRRERAASGRGAERLALDAASVRPLRVAVEVCDGRGGLLSVNGLQRDRLRGIRQLRVGEWDRIARAVSEKRGSPQAFVVPDGDKMAS